MSLTTHLGDYASDSIKHNGDNYWRSGRVNFIDVSDLDLKAEVNGSRRYEVNLKLGREHGDLVIGAECTCPYYEDHLDVCKHIWATLLKAEQHRYLEKYGNPVWLITDTFLEDLDDGFRGFKPNKLAKPNTKTPPPPPKKPPPPSWQSALEQLKRSAQAASRERPSTQVPCQLSYVVDLVYTYHDNTIPLELRVHDRLKKGGWSRPTAKRISSDVINALEDPEERRHLLLFQGVSQNDYGSAYQKYNLTRQMCSVHLPWISDTGRLFLRLSQMKEPEPLRWDTGDPWSLRTEWNRDGKGKRYLLSGVLARGEERLPLTEARIHCRMVFAKGLICPLEEGVSAEWLNLLRKEKQLAVADADRDRFVTAVSEVPTQTPFDFPEEFGVTFQAATPRGALRVRPFKQGPDLVEGQLRFQYGNHVIPDNAGSKSSSYFPEQRLFTRRDIDEEQALRGRLEQLGFRDHRYGEYSWRLAAKKLPAAVRQLTQEGWQIEAEGKLYRPGGEIKIDVATNIDWFELNAQVQFGDQTIPLPRLLQALRKGENMVTLDDGSFGILPEDWLKKYGIFASVGEVEGDVVRFKKAQVGLLDALLAAQPEASFDAAFTRAREEFRSFEGIAPVQPPESFQGTLRGYQSEGLGWLLFLNRFGWGGCLADDMGLGKTVQVLALLTHRAAHRKKNDIRPSLIVAPRSLMFNWAAEAARFAPHLSVLDHHRPDRCKDAKVFADHDIVLTTYGILRRDAALFAECQFDYCILDESQAIKNAGTEQAKAVRLLQGQHRLAMSGTPIENHLGELWSLFEFLNPGMLGAASVFKITGVGARNPEPETRELLSKALRPMILRRTKSQVAKDLPEKTEQTVFCDLDVEQRKLYDELRDYYRGALLKKIADDGMNKAKIMVLEALLRLRQAACHPGLIDKKHIPVGSAKLDILLPQLHEVFEEGHKAIVFSQFTSFLSIVKKQLDKDKIPYEYLDGKTRDRAARVERFQNDPDCKLFLISLKAGGMGLNLTAAEYVFLLDPWWNPAVEAQAIDRAHRIGQTKPVFAYRLIARGTVEEKVLELQKNKRELADAILNSDNSLIGGLKREDLELLLS